jgi:tetratricopeptide (TPR) repeat protein
MFQNNLVKTATRFALLITCMFTLWQPVALHAQGGESVEELKAKVRVWMKQQKYTEALPILEKLVAAEPDNPETHFYLGFALIAQANATKDDAAQKALRIRARKSFIKSKELGNKEPLVDALIQSIPADGSAGKEFSKNAEANRLMTDAEALFGKGKLDDALEDYQKALLLDPTLYEAALFSGDVYTQKGEFAQAETWYQKAISIDPDREIAYRYSATPLMKQGKYNEARDRYVESFISEPYSRFAISGLSQWARITNTKIAHPAIDIPTDVSFDEKGDAKINLNINSLLGGKDDGSFAWVVYGTTRSSWRKEKFAKTFPGEKAYRHSLAEEAEALRSVLTLATGDKKASKLNPSLAKLKKLNDEGLLEAYILLARPDQDIANEYPAYRGQNREKLRRYVVEYILTGGGK